MLVTIQYRDVRKVEIEVTDMQAILCVPLWTDVSVTELIARETRYAAEMWRNGYSGAGTGSVTGCRKDGNYQCSVLITGKTENGGGIRYVRSTSPNWQ